MSQENVEGVRRAIAYEYDGVGDLADAEAIFDPHVVLNPIDEAASSGFAAMRADMERWASAFDELKVTIEEIIDAGVKSSWSPITRGEATPSGVEVDTRFYEVYTWCGARSRAWTSTSSAPKPSKPWGYGSRRCRRRTWRSSCAQDDGPNLALVTASAELRVPV